jgi:hypothetical protein
MSWMVAQTIARQLLSKVQHIDLIGTLPHEASQAFNSVGRLNVPVHHLRKSIKGQEMLFVLSQASHRLWIALAILGFEGAQLSQGLLFCRLIPDANQFSLDLSPLSSRDGGEHIALFMHQAALAWGSRKEFGDGSEQALVSIGDDEIDLDSPRVRRSCSRASQPSLLSSAQARSARTSLLPSRSTPNAVKMMVESALFP